MLQIGAWIEKKFTQAKNSFSHAKITIISRPFTVRHKYNQYGAVKMEFDGIKFDSKLEGQYYLYLKQIKDTGEVVQFDRHRFIFQEGPPTRWTSMSSGRTGPLSLPM